MVCAIIVYVLLGNEYKRWIALLLSMRLETIVLVQAQIHIASEILEALCFSK